MTTKKRVLVVEDDRATARLVEAVLANTAQVEVFGTGEEALQAIRQHAPDMVLSDIGLPGLSGVQPTY